jgi:hypothetical protein
MTVLASAMVQADIREIYTCTGFRTFSMSFSNESIDILRPVA